MACDSLKIVGIVQARTGSQRLPGKVLLPVAGKPLLQYLLERVSRSRYLRALVVATSQGPGDDHIEALCRELGLSCYRGALENVASRFYEVLKLDGYEAFVRINGDSPLLDQRLIDRGIELYRDHHCEIVTNVFPRTYPTGQSVEVIAAAVFKQAFPQMTKPDDLEHVTSFFYRAPHLYKIMNFAAEEPFDGVHLAVDTAEDFRLFAALIARMERPHWEYGVQEIVELYHQLS